MPEMQGPSPPKDADPQSEGTFWFRQFQLEKMKGIETKIDALTSNQKEITTSLESIKLEVGSFKLVRQVVFAGVALILMAVVGGVVALVVTKPH